MKKVLLSGNEAFARGAFEAGVKFASAYPGTPSTEILENISRYSEIYSEWCPNEKVALEVAGGAAVAGARSLAAMKHVGLNVAADPLFTLSYTGIEAGLVVITADDPNMYSSQNEQDNRHYARASKIPMLEPSDSQEAKDFISSALKISEKFDTPVLLRSTTRVSHSKTIVTLKEREEFEIKLFEKNTKKYVMIPAHARVRHKIVEKRLVELKKFSNSFSLNSQEIKDEEIGVISSGAVFQYVREALPFASFLKLSMIYPLPEETIRKFANQVKSLYVIEELDPFLEEQILSMGIKVIGKEITSQTGELSPELIREGFKKKTGKKFAVHFEESRTGNNQPATGKEKNIKIPIRPPVMCPGCPHRGIFYVLKKLKLIVMGDIGCYTLGVLPPLNAMDSCVCMGAGVGMAHGFEKASGSYKGKVVGVIGDSTFVHSGITPLINMAYNLSAGTVIILDNRTTAMTGRQHHPGTGFTLKGEKTKALDLEEISKASGADIVRRIDSYNLEEIEKTIKEEVEREKLSVIISENPCVLLTKEPTKLLSVINDLCKGCWICLKLGCPAISREGDIIAIDPLLCTGCGICMEVCKFDAIK